MTREEIQAGAARRRATIRRFVESLAPHEILAGMALAAMSIPQALGYARIAGMPVVTGLYTLLLPMVVFAALGSSRYLVVAADSATAAIIASQVAVMAPIAGAHYVALAGVVALITAAFLLIAYVFDLGFLADFLSQTVLVGFLTGVGIQVGVAMLSDMLGLPAVSRRTLEQMLHVAHGFWAAKLPTVSLAAGVVIFVLILRKVAPRFPAPFVAVVGAIAASAVYDLGGYGIAMVERVTPGLPSLGVPDAVMRDIPQLLPASASCFLVIITQSAATARAYALRHRGTLDENRDLLGLCAANAAAGLSGTFVVNGSPTQTAMLESSGGQGRLAHFTTGTIVLLVLLFLTEPLHYLPRCVLAAVVFTIAIELIDIRGLRAILIESPGEFELALITAATVVLIGVEQGIVLAIVLSLLRHVRHSYRPHTAVLIDEGGRWKAIPAVPGAQTTPGLIVFQFGADLFYANAGRFAQQVRALIDGAPASVNYVVLDAGAITSIDYSASRVLAALDHELHNRGILLLLVHAEQSLIADLERHRLGDITDHERMFDTLREALAAINEHRIRPILDDDVAPKEIVSGTRE